MRTSLAGLAAILAASALFAAACGSSDGSSFGDGTDAGDNGGGGNEAGGPLGPSFGNEGGAPTKGIKALAIDPPTASLLVEVGQAPPTQAFKVTATYVDGTKSVLSTGISFSVTLPQVGAIGGSGLYAPSGAQGGHVVVTAAAGGQQATASVDVKLHATRVTPAGSVDAANQAALKAAATPDGAVTWAYPYDATVFPRGLNAPELQWLGGADADFVYVHVTSPFYEYESFGTAASQRFSPDGADWTQLVDSTSGNVAVHVARLAGGAGGAATVLKDQVWSIAPGTMRGTIYYWAINTGRVMRITPGASVPDDLFAGVNVVPPAKGACIACHSVSANGASVVVNAGHWDSSIDETSVNWDLVGSTAAYSGAEVTNGGSAFAQAGISADGKVMVQNFAPLRGNFATTMGAFDAKTGAAIPSTNLETKKLYMPSFSPDNKALLYVDGNPGDLRAYDWDPVTLKATNDHLVVAAGADATLKYIQFPTVTPDHQYVLYQRSSNYGSLGIAGDLYLAPVAGGGAEVKLGNLDGDAYSFAAGARDKHLDYEPTFAPVASGGKFWVVFHSRRTYGNELTGPAYVKEGQGVKQLWVAAIDQTPTPGVDPSHPAFHLPGQSLATLNMRGFWALEPCKGNGTGCGSGTECCGGYCAGGGDAGGLVCSATTAGCSQEGDKCKVAADCCNSGGGAMVCINSVCSFGSVK